MSYFVSAYTVSTMEHINDLLGEIEDYSDYINEHLHISLLEVPDVITTHVLNVLAESSVMIKTVNTSNFKNREWFWCYQSAVT